MRLLSLCLFLLLGSPVGTTSGQPSEKEQLFAAGNDKYEQGDFATALHYYRSVLDQGYASGALYQNMGNAYFRLDSLGQAIRYYEKALRLTPDDPRLLHNLEIARSRTAGTFPELPPPFWRPWWDRFIALVGVIGLFVVGMLCYVAAVGLLAYRLRTRQRNPWLRRALTLTILGGLVLLTAAFAASIDRSRTSRAVVVDAQVPLREAPDALSAVQNVPEGTVLDVLDADTDWRQVRLPNGATGWLAAHAIAEI